MRYLQRNYHEQSQDSKKNVKKNPLLTAKERKAAKQAKKDDNGSILGKH